MFIACQRYCNRVTSARLSQSLHFFFLQSALISDEKAKEFRDKVYGVIKLTKVIQYILIGLGAFCILVAIVLAIVLFCIRGRAREVNMLNLFLQNTI